MLYVIPTPIGNLDDITWRAVKLLSTVDTLLCEDSRSVRKLLTLLEISHKPQMIDLTRYHQFNFAGIRKILDILLENPEQQVGLVTDTGTPGISDPGREVIQLAQEKQVEYTVLPGATALIPAVVASGLVAKEFHFVGFLPIKKGRQTKWQEITQSSSPIVLLESVHRLSKFLREAQEYLSPSRYLSIHNEISKKFERRWLSRVKELPQLTEEIVYKGEFCVVIEGCHSSSRKSKSILTNSYTQTTSTSTH
jgi:16S rRNA (cytidine1402-2'-O)-methyltransferase